MQLIDILDFFPEENQYNYEIWLANHDKPFFGKIASLVKGRTISQILDLLSKTNYSNIKDSHTLFAGVDSSDILKNIISSRTGVHYRNTLNSEITEKIILSKNIFRVDLKYLFMAGDIIKGNLHLCHISNSIDKDSLFSYVGSQYGILRIKY